MRIYKLFLFSLFIFISILTGCSQIDFQEKDNLDDVRIVENPSVNAININQVWAEVNRKLPKSPNGKNFIFERITVEEGLSNPTVRTITQDKFGYIWIGTDYGLNRFDGDEFIIYKHDSENDHSLSDDHIWVIFEDSKENVWIGTDNGLNVFDRKQNNFNKFFHDESNPMSLGSNRIRAIQEDDLGNLWIGTWGGGLDRYNPESGEFIHFKANEATNYSISDNFVRVVYKDSIGYLWVGTSNGLNRFDPRSTGEIIFQHDFSSSEVSLEDESEVFNRENLDYYWTHRPSPLDTPQNVEKPQFLVNNQIQAIVEDEREQKIWIGTSGGLDCLDLPTGKFDHFRLDSENEKSLSSNLILSLMVDQNGVLWAGTNYGLNEFVSADGYFNRYSFNPVNNDSMKSPNNPIINTIFQDRSGAIWLGTSGGGINRFDYSTDFFIHNHHDEDLQNSVSGNMIWDFEEDTDLGYWVGTGVGIDRYNIQDGNFEHYPIINESSTESLPVQVYTIYKAYDTRVWAGTSDGLYLLNQENKQFIRYNGLNEPEVQNNNPLVDSIILDIIEPAPGHLLIGTYGSGLLSLDLNSGLIKVFNFDQNNQSSISSNIISSLFFDSRGITYIGTRGGGLNLLYPDSDNFVRITSGPNTANSISDNNINQIIQTDDGSIWIATMGGLNRFDPETSSFLTLNEDNGLPSNVVYGVVEDPMNAIWVSTNNGIAKITPDLSVSAVYRFPDGLQGNEFNPGASFISSDGLIFFGGTNGFSVFRPELIQQNPYVSPAVLSSFTQNREDIDLPVALEYVKSVELEWPRNYFEFKLSNMNFIQSDKNLVAFRLIPMEENWTIANSGVHQSYENLDGGVYTLQVKGANNDGSWSDTSNALIINIKPPFWERPGIQLGGGLTLLALVLAGVQLRVRNVQRYSRVLEKEVQDRTADIEKRRKVAEGLREILLRINSDLSLAEILDYVVCQTTRLIGTDWAFIFSHLNDEPGMLAQSVSAPDQFGDKFSDFQYELLMQEWNKKSKKLKNIQTYKIRKSTKDGSLSFIVVPILSANSVLGGLALLNHPELTMNEEDLDLLRSLADQAALAIENARLKSTSEEMAVITERNRIARDLHDAITQTLFSANLIAESLPQTISNDRFKGEQSLKSLQNLNKSALAEMRALLLELRPDVIKDISLSDLIKQMADTLRGRANVNVDLDLQENFQIPEQVHLQFYRIAQEIITNIIKHARAENVRINLMTKSYKRGKQRFVSVKMIIADDGIGFSEEEIRGVHFGLHDIAERTDSINANLKIESAPNQGTMIGIEWKNKDNLDDGCQ